METDNKNTVQSVERSMHWTSWLLLALLFAVLIALQSAAVWRIYASSYPGTADYYSRWAGARALLLSGRDPYDPEVTVEIQEVLGIDTAMVGKGGFAYPLYVVFTFWPLVYVPYAWAQAVWMVVLQWIAVACTLALLKLERWKPSLPGLLGLVFATLVFYPVARTIMLGQFTLHVTLFLVLALWALQTGRDGWAGIALAATTIKPQMVILVGPWLVLWAVINRRWRMLGGLVVGGAVLFFAALALFPRWPISFVEDVLRYNQVAGGRNPLAVLIDMVWPGSPEAVQYILTALLVLTMIAAWVRALRSKAHAFGLANHWTITVSLLILFQTGTTNQVLLLIPFFAWLNIAYQRWSRVWVSLGVAALVISLWVLFLTTIHGDWEDPVMFLPLPLFSLAVLVVIELSRWRNGRSVKGLAQTDTRS